MDALINIDVPNLEEAIRFYEAAVGLRARRLLFGDTVAEMMVPALFHLPHRET